MIKKFIPANVKRAIRIAQRKNKDRKSGFSNQLAKKIQDANKKEMKVVCKITQPIFYNPLAANKVTNIQIAINELEQVIIQPNEYFSFWNIIEEPTEKKGYLTGRNIIGNRLQEDIGGGLCQVSGMLYHLALSAGLKIIERHNHTLDLYEEDKRYTPLGADATVVYGYKDLRFQNDTPYPLQFSFEVNQTSFSGYLNSTEPFPQAEINFIRLDHTTSRTIETRRKKSGKIEVVNTSKYILP